MGLPEGPRVIVLEPSISYLSHPGYPCYNSKMCDFELPSKCQGQRNDKGLKGILTMPIEVEGQPDLTKAEVLKRLSNLYDSLIITQEIGEEKTEDGTIKEYPHIHVAYQTAKKNLPTKQQLEAVMGRYVWVSVHSRKDTAAAYVLKEDKSPLIENWADWNLDKVKGTYAMGTGKKAAKAKAAWAGDVAEMKSLDMAPREVNAELQALAPIDEEVKQRERPFQNTMDLKFEDYRTKKSLTFTPHFGEETPYVTLMRKGIDTRFEGRRGIWIHGPTRTGKTYQSVKLVEKYDGYRCDDPKNFEGYSGQQLIFLNDLDHTHFPIPSEFRRFVDAARYNRKYGSKAVNPDHTFFIVTSNYSIEDLWRNGLGPRVEDYRLSIEAIQAVFFEVKLTGKFVKEGVITYGKSAYDLGNSDSDEDTPKKKAKLFASAYEEEVASCEKLVKSGDQETILEDGVWKRILKLDGRLYIKTLEKDGTWSQVEIS